MKNRLYIEDDLDNSLEDIYKLFEEKNNEDIISTVIDVDEENNKFINIMVSCYIEELKDYFDVDIKLTKDVLIDMLDKIK